MAIPVHSHQTEQHRGPLRSAGWANLCRVALVLALAGLSAAPAPGQAPTADESNNAEAADNANPAPDNNAEANNADGNNADANNTDANDPASNEQAEAAEANEPADPPADPIEAPDRAGRLLRLRLPITGSADSAFRSIVDRTKQQLLAEANQNEGGDRQRPVIVIEFAPLASGDGFGQGTDFARALSLARYLTSDELAGIKTVAFIPRTVKGHAVLVALACEEIAMASTAELGEAGIDEDPTRPIEPAVLEGYRQIARARRTAPEAIALGMVDRSMEVLEVETEASIEFVLREDLAEVEKEQAVVRATPLFAAGSMGLVSARQGRKYGAVKYLVEDRESLSGILRLDPSALAEDSALVADWRPIMYTVEGPITATSVSRARRLIDNEVAQNGANWIGMRIASSGGSVAFAQDLATYFSQVGGNLQGQATRSVAYVPESASGVAALVALAGDQLVMHRGATVGGDVTPPLTEGELASLRVTVEDSLAPNSPHTWSLLMATVDPELEVFRYTNRQSGVERLFSEEEADAQADAGDWRQGEAITKPGEVLQLDSDTAAALGIATHVVDNLEELNQIYGFPASPSEVEATWSLELADALASPGITVLLLVIAFAGIYFELHTPGLGIGGFVAAVALLLFFWSKALHGTVEWLEVLLFVGGLVSILLEIFVLPGVGIFGLGGALMVVAALVLAGQRSLVPKSAEEFAELQTSLAVVASAGVLMVVVSLVLRRYLPKIPILNDMMLAGPQGEALAELNYRESLAEYSHLVGQQGMTTTPLMPSGRAEIDGELIDVIAAGEVIERGVAVEVVSAKGSRVEVRVVKS